MLLDHLQKYSHPTAVDISQKLYVNNILSGTETEAEAIPYYKQARSIMEEGHFVLRQWPTNSEALQAVINKNNTGIKTQAISLLGLQCCPSTDSISVQGKCFDTPLDSISVQGKCFDTPLGSMTKHNALRIVSQLYDPLGLISPISILSRLFIANLRDEKFGWDQPFPAVKDTM